MKKNNTWIIPVIAALTSIVACAAFVMFKLGQMSAADKWRDYDDYGWS